jgi:3-deoxy-D-manno-octulosonic-acid transferase
LELLYTALLYLIQPLVWLRLLLRSRKAPAYRKRWKERYGFCQNKVEPGGILLHSVSVGETLAAIPLSAKTCITSICLTICPAR